MAFQFRSIVLASARSPNYVVGRLSSIIPSVQAGGNKKSSLLQHVCRRSFASSRENGNGDSGNGSSAANLNNEGQRYCDKHSVMSHSSLLQRAQREYENSIHKDAESKPETKGGITSAIREETHKLNDASQRPVCLVIGAGPGIGTSVAARFAREGYATAVARRDGQTLQDIVRRIRDDGGIADDTPIVPYQCDAREEEEVLDLFENVVNTLGHIDVCVFNIGSNISYPLIETSTRKFRKCWEMGCFSGFLVGREAARHMLKRKAGGTIIFTGATASLRGAANFSAFATTKAGLRALSQSMARELGPEGIHVAHVVIDGVVDTPWIRKNFADALERLPADGICKPTQIAEVYWQLSQQDRCAWTHELDLRPYSERF